VNPALPFLPSFDGLSCCYSSPCASVCRARSCASFFSFLPKPPDLALSHCVKQHTLYFLVNHGAHQVIK
jgi:hypothetical protein